MLFPSVINSQTVKMICQSTKLMQIINFFPIIDQKCIIYYHMQHVSMFLTWILKGQNNCSASRHSQSQHEVMSDKQIISVPRYGTGLCLLSQQPNWPSSMTLVCSTPMWSAVSGMLNTISTICGVTTPSWLYNSSQSHRLDDSTWSLCQFVLGRK